MAEYISTYVRVIFIVLGAVALLMIRNGSERRPPSKIDDKDGRIDANDPLEFIFLSDKAKLDAGLIMDPDTRRRDMDLNIQDRIIREKTEELMALMAKWTENDDPDGGAMKCPACGAPLPVNGIRCDYCRTVLTDITRKGSVNEFINRLTVIEGYRPVIGFMRTNKILCGYIENYPVLMIAPEMIAFMELAASKIDSNLIARDSQSVPNLIWYKKFNELYKTASTLLSGDDLKTLKAIYENKMTDIENRAAEFKRRSEMAELESKNTEQDADKYKKKAFLVAAVTIILILVIISFT